MMEVEITAESRRQMFDLPVVVLRRVEHVLDRLEKWPAVSGTKPLTGPLKGNRRIRTGDWRVLFRVDAGRIVVWRIDNRKDVYNR